MFDRRGHHLLIDGERLTVGWWGRDAATVLIEASKCLTHDGEILSIWRHGLDIFRADGPSGSRIAAWLVLETANAVARNATLLSGGADPSDVQRCRLASRFLRDAAVTL
jgi:hypothetical protein